MEMTITFPGGKRVDAQFDGFVVPTDQKPIAGGAGSAPEPFSLFLASIGTCAGIYALGFCQARGISTEGLRLVEHAEFDPATHRLARVSVEIQVPPTFPAKYLSAVRNAAENCAVKRAIFNPPEFVVETRVVGTSVASQAVGG